jgi:subtilisin-like proprotein convertase family protein
MTSETRPRRLRLIGVAFAPILAMSVASIGHAEPAGNATRMAGDGTWCNDTPIAVPGYGEADAASPYSTEISVDGAGNSVTGLNVQLLEVDHERPNDLDVILEGPTGQSLVLMSDTGGFDHGPARDLTFSDGAAGPLPQFDLLTAGSYLPTNWEDDGTDMWVPPAPPDSGSSTMAAFNGSDPNGSWRLFVVDDDSGAAGSIGGWCLSITSEDVADSTVTELATSPNPSTPGEETTLTATVTRDGGPVMSGTVEFRDGTATLADVAVDASGQAAFTTDQLDLGRHLVTARFDGGGNVGASTRSVIHTVTTLASGTWCNNGLITMSDAATVAASEVTVEGAGNTINAVTVDLGGFSHQSPLDVQVMLVSPTGQSLVLMSDAGGFDRATAVGLTFSDTAAGPIPEFDPLNTGTYLPTNGSGGRPDLWLRPAPPDSGATTMATFNGSDPNGSWHLFVVDESTGAMGWIDGGWCLTISTEDVAEATATALAASPSPSAPGESVTFTAAVTSAGDPVTSGTVEFRDGATTLADVAVDANGRAAFTTDDLAVGRHVITARFAGSVGRGPSARSVVHTVTTLAGGRWCSNGAIRVPSTGSAGPYPSTITVRGAGTFTTQVVVRLGDVNHENPADLDVMLVSPTGQRLVVMGDVGDENPVSGVDLTISDRATRPLPDDVPWRTLTYRPTDLDRGDRLPVPAPLDSGATTLATFNGSNPNGTWRLFVADDEGGDRGWIGGGWCLDIAVDQRGPQARPAVSPAPNAAGWHRGDVTVNWNWSDAGSGVDPARCTDQTTTNRQGRHTLAATCQDRLGHRSSAARTVRVDSTAPTLRIFGPAARRYVKGAKVRADYACADRLSGIARCTGSVRDGASIDTARPGRHRFTVTAIDRAGNQHASTVAYTVVAPPTCAGQPATIVGSAGSDVVTGTPGADVIVTGGGTDSIFGRGGRDTICAGAGDDNVDGGGGSDRIDGGAGDDLCRGGPGTDLAVACEATLDIP